MPASPRRSFDGNGEGRGLIAVRSWETAALAIFIAMLAAGAVWKSGLGFRVGGFRGQDFWGLCGHGWSSFCWLNWAEVGLEMAYPYPRAIRMVIKTKELQEGQFETD